VERHGRVALSTLEEVEALLVDKLVLSHQILSSGLCIPGIVLGESNTSRGGLDTFRIGPQGQV